MTRRTNKQRVRPGARERARSVPGKRAPRRDPRRWWSAKVLWAGLLVPLIPVIVAVVQNWQNMPWTAETPRPTLKITSVRIYAWEVKYRRNLTRREQESRRVRNILDCPGTLLTVTLTAHNLTAGPYLRWVLVDTEDGQPWPVPPALRPTVEVRARREGGVERVWVPAVDRLTTVRPRIDAFIAASNANAAEIPAHADSSGVGPLIRTFPIDGDAPGCIYGT